MPVMVMKMQPLAQWLPMESRAMPGGLANPNVHCWTENTWTRAGKEDGKLSVCSVPAASVPLSRRKQLHGILTESHRRKSSTTTCEAQAIEIEAVRLEAALPESFNLELDSKIIEEDRVNPSKVAIKPVQLELVSNGVQPVNKEQHDDHYNWGPVFLNEQNFRELHLC